MKSLLCSRFGKFFFLLEFCLIRGLGRPRPAGRRRLSRVRDPFGSQARNCAFAVPCRRRPQAVVHPTLPQRCPLPPQRRMACAVLHSPSSARLRRRCDLAWAAAGRRRRWGARRWGVLREAPRSWRVRSCLANAPPWIVLSTCWSGTGPSAAMRSSAATARRTTGWLCRRSSSTCVSARGRPVSYCYVL